MVKPTKEVVTQSRLTCPECDHSEILVMPTDACQWFYECLSCHTLLKPKMGDCCVFCSYGSIPCPPIQQQNRDGNNGCCGTK